MSLDVTIIYKKPKMVKYNATHAACGSTFMIVPDDIATEETEWSANITHNMSRMALQVPICVKYRNIRVLYITMYGSLERMAILPPL